MSAPHIDPRDYHFVNKKMNEFFEKKGLIHSYVQNRLDILSACENPDNISVFEYDSTLYPMKQTGQLNLEILILKDGPESPGFCCDTTSYRAEKNPIPGRHDSIFFMKEFEIPGDMNDLINFEKELLEYMGFGDKSTYVELDYLDACKKYGVEEINHEEEMMLCRDFGPVVFLKNFPLYTSPFWNMAVHQDQPTIAKKIDVILYGQETIGSAEREVDPKIMREKFFTISEGQYAKKLTDTFGEERVVKELDDFLNNHQFFTRSGAGCGGTRMIRACKMHGLI